MALLNNFLQEPEFECIFHPAWGKQFVPRSSSGSYQGVRQFILVLEVFRTEDLSAHSLACFTCNLIQLGTIFFLPYYVSCSAKKKKKDPNTLMKYCERKVFLQEKLLLKFTQPVSLRIAPACSFPGTWSMRCCFDVTVWIHFTLEPVIVENSGKCCFSE